MERRPPRPELAALRLQAGYSQESLARKIDVTVGSVRGWETGTRTPRPMNREPLARVLSISMATLNGILDPDAAVQLNGHPVPVWLSHYESLVLAAGRLAVVERSAIHGLLQTKAYASAVERYGPLQLTDEQILQRVEVRLARQTVLHREIDPLESVSLLAEAALRENVGGADVMIEQLDHLIEVAQRPNVDVRILPADGRAIVVRGGFELLTRSGDVQPFMVVTFDVGGVNYEEGDYKIEPFVTMFDHLMGSALSPADSIDHIETIREDYRR